MPEFILAQVVEHGRRTRYANCSWPPACTVDIQDALIFTTREAALEFLEMQEAPVFTNADPSWHVRTL